MTLKETQELVDAWINKHGVRYFSELANMTILTEEVGELARIMVRTYGEQSSKPGDIGGEAKSALSDEIADVLWVLICIANQTGVDLTEAITDNLSKKNRRDGDRHKNNPKLK